MKSEDAVSLTFLGTTTCNGKVVRVYALKTTVKIFRIIDTYLRISQRFQFIHSTDAINALNLKTNITAVSICRCDIQSDSVSHGCDIATLPKETHVFAKHSIKLHLNLTKFAIGLCFVMFWGAVV